MRGFANIALFVVVALALVGGGAYWWHDMKERASIQGKTDADFKSDPAMNAVPPSKGPDYATLVLLNQSESEDYEPAEMGTTTQVTAYIKAVYGNTVTLDYFDILPIEEIEKIALDSGCPPENVKERACLTFASLHVSNKNPKLRTFELSPTVRVKYYPYEEESRPTLAGLTDFLSDMTTEYSREIPFVITFDAEGRVVNIEQIYET